MLNLKHNPPYGFTARAWLDEPLGLPYNVVSVVEKRLGDLVARQKQASKATLEILIPQGGKFAYGLLSGEFVPNESSKELVVQVATCQTGPSITDWSLARNLDAVKSGIPTWATEEILNAALEAVETQPIGPGYLRFPFGAHGEIGSNTWVFRGLTKAIVTLISKDGRSLSEEELSSILRRHLS